MSSPQKVIDLTRDLEAATRLGTSLEVIDQVLGESLEALETIVPYDLATVMELDGNELSVRVARGRLAESRVNQHAIQLSEFPSVREALEDGRARAFVEHDHRDGDGDPFDGVLDLPEGHFCMIAPVRAGGGPLGLITVDRADCGVFSDGAVQLAELFGKLLGLVINYGEQSMRLERMQIQLEEQNRLLAERVGGRSEAARLLESSDSPAMRHVVQLARQVARTDTPVLLTGETGTGKELLANAIHAWSERADKPMVSINCAALPASLIESELFGHVKGAFSGAVSNRIGRFQTANGGTLFLDEVAEIPLDLQAKLLRVLQEGCFEPVGSDRTVRVDVRIISATNRDLRLAIEDGSMRDDLYYRLAVFPVHLPPLRARREDIPGIAHRILERLVRRTGRGPWQLRPADVAELQRREWRGNVREMVNALERATILSQPPNLSIRPELDIVESVVDAEPRESAESIATLVEMEREHIERALRLTKGKIYGRRGAAELLAINPSTLHSRMKKLGLGGAREAKRRNTSRNRHG